MVDEMTKLSDEVQRIDARLNSPELQGADYEEFSSQEDKLKVGLVPTVRNARDSAKKKRPYIRLSEQP